MLEFGSWLTATEAALALAEPREPKGRVGVHLSDVVVQPDGNLLDMVSMSRRDGWPERIPARCWSPFAGYTDGARRSLHRSALKRGRQLVKASRARSSCAMNRSVTTATHPSTSGRASAASSGALELSCDRKSDDIAWAYPNVSMGGTPSSSLVNALTEFNASDAKVAVLCGGRCVLRGSESEVCQRPRGQERPRGKRV